MGARGFRNGVVIRTGTIALALAAAGPALAQDAARMDSIERQIRALQSELSRLRREATARDAEARTAREEAARARAEAREETARARAEAREAQRRLDTTARPAAAPAQPRPETESSPGERALVSFPNGRPTIKSSDGRMEFSIGGQLQFDVGGAIYGAPGPRDQRGLPELNAFGQNLRRGRLYVAFRYDDVEVRITPEFGGLTAGTPTIFEAHLNWMPVEPLTMTLGYFEPWYTLYDSMSKDDYRMLEWPSIIEIARNITAGTARAVAGGRWAQDRWFASAYLTGDFYGQDNETRATRGQTGFVGRVAGRPYVTPDVDLHLGFSGSYSFDLRRQTDGQTLRLSDQPEFSLDSQTLIDTGRLPAKNASTWGPEFAIRWRNFLLQGEYIRIGVDQSNARGVVRPNLSFEGGYVEASWVITGEQQPYNSTAAAFARPEPARPFSFREGGWGAWELAARYSVADLNDRVRRGVSQTVTGGVFGGRQEVIGTSLSWYPNNFLRFLLNWNIVNVDRLNAAGTTQIGQRFHTIGLRSQLEF